MNRRDALAATAAIAAVSLAVGWAYERQPELTVFGIGLASVYLGLRARQAEAGATIGP